MYSDSFFSLFFFSFIFLAFFHFSRMEVDMFGKTKIFTQLIFFHVKKQPRTRLLCLMAFVKPLTHVKAVL